jgi:hypothetical protein
LKRKAVEEVSPKTGHWGKKWREGQAWIILAKDGAPKIRRELVCTKNLCLFQNMEALGFFVVLF